MQRPDEQKRATILRVAADLFARRPFHEVRLDDVAAAARVGKGTVYVYFASKDALYLEMVRDALDALVDEVTAVAADESVPAWDTLDRMVRAYVAWAQRHAAIYELMRSNVHPAGTQVLRRRRRDLGELFERVLRRGVAAGEIDDDDPALTAQFVPAMIRAAVVWGPKGRRAEAVAGHIMGLLARGVRKERAR